MDTSCLYSSISICILNFRLGLDHPILFMFFGHSAYTVAFEYIVLSKGIKLGLKSRRRSSIAQF